MAFAGISWLIYSWVKSARINSPKFFVASVIAATAAAFIILAQLSLGYSTGQFLGLEIVFAFTGALCLSLWSVRKSIPIREAILKRILQAAAVVPILLGAWAIPATDKIAIAQIAPPAAAGEVTSAQVNAAESYLKLINLPDRFKGKKTRAERQAEFESAFIGDPYINTYVLFKEDSSIARRLFRAGDKFNPYVIIPTQDTKLHEILGNGGIVLLKNGRILVITKKVDFVVGKYRASANCDAIGMKQDLDSCRFLYNLPFSSYFLSVDYLADDYAYNYINLSIGVPQAGVAAVIQRET